MVGSLRLMAQAYVAAASICAASLLVGNALAALAGWQWSWLEPGVGFGALVAGAGAVSWASGSDAAVAAALAAAVLAAAAVSRGLPRPRPGRRRQAVAVAALLLAVLAVPLAALSGHLGSLEEASRPAADNALGPESLAAAVAAIPGLRLEHAFLGELLAIPVLSGLTALAALDRFDPARRVLAACMVALAYMSACFFALAAIRTTAEALFVLTLAVALLQLERRLASGANPAAGPPGGTALWRSAPAPAALAAGAFFCNSFAGLVWLAAIAGRWSLNRPEVRRALHPRSLPALLRNQAVRVALVLLAAFALLAATVVPFSVDAPAAAGLGEPVSPVAGLGIWPHASYPLQGSYTIADWMAVAVAGATILIALLWWLRRHEEAVPVAFGVSSVIYLLQPLFSGQYSRAQALAIVAPLAMLVVMRPLLEETGGGATPLKRVGRLTRRRAGPGSRRFAWAVLACAFIGGAVFSTGLALASVPDSPGLS